MKSRSPIRPKSIPSHLGLLLGLLLAGPLVGVVAAQPYGLQYGAQRDRAAAEQLKAELEQQNLGPVTVLSDAEWHRVVVGRYRVFVDAQIAKDDVRKRTGREVFIRAIPAAQGAVYTDATAAITPFFKNQSGERVTSAPESLKGNAAYERLEALDTPGNKDAYAAALRAELPGLSDTNPLKGYVLTNLGIVEIIAKRYDAALELLRPVADGDVAAAKAHRVMAMRRVAWITHWQKGDRLAAYRAYRELEKFSGSESVKSLCKVECAGLLMELAESGVGTHDDVRAEIALALDGIAGSDIAHRATLELMLFETYSRQPVPDHLLAARLGEEFLVRYSGRPEVARELSTATYQTGLYYYRAGDYEHAKEFYARVFRDFPADVDHFAGLHPYSQALLGYANLYHDEGDWEAAMQVMRDIVELYPGEDAAKRIEEEFPRIKLDYEPSKSIAK